MRTIGSLTNEKTAARFSDFLFLRGIENQFEEEEDGSFSLWVMDEEHVSQAADWFAKFRANPEAAEFSAAANAAEKLRRTKVKSEESRRSTVADVARLDYERHFQAAPYVTYALMVISIAVSVYSEIGENRRAIQPFVITPYDVRTGEYLTGLPEVTRGQVWRLITPIFIHFRILHIFFNMLLLKDLGAFLESRFGAGYMLALVLISAVLSNLGEYVWSGPWFGGMSGVNYALFGFLWIRGRYDRFTSWQLPQNTIYLMVGWFFLCLTGLLGPIANGAHAVGLAAGMLWGFVSAKRPFSR